MSQESVSTAYDSHKSVDLEPGFMPKMGSKSRRSSEVSGLHKSLSERRTNTVDIHHVIVDGPQTKGVECLMSPRLLNENNTFDADGFMMRDDEIALKSIYGYLKMFTSVDPSTTEKLVRVVKDRRYTNRHVCKKMLTLMPRLPDDYHIVVWKGISNYVMRLMDPSNSDRRASVNQANLNSTNNKLHKTESSRGTARKSKDHQKKLSRNQVKTTNSNNKIKPTTAREDDDDDDDDSKESSIPDKADDVDYQSGGGTSFWDELSDKTFEWGREEPNFNFKPDDLLLNSLTEAKYKNYIDILSSEKSIFHANSSTGITDQDKKISERCPQLPTQGLSSSKNALQKFAKVANLIQLGVATIMRFVKKAELDRPAMNDALLTELQTEALSDENTEASVEESDEDDPASESDDKFGSLGSGSNQTQSTNEYTMRTSSSIRPVKRKSVKASSQSLASQMSISTTAVGGFNILHNEYGDLEIVDEYGLRVEDTEDVFGTAIDEYFDESGRAVVNNPYLGDNHTDVVYTKSGSEIVNIAKKTDVPNKIFDKSGAEVINTFGLSIPVRMFYSEEGENVGMLTLGAVPKRKFVDQLDREIINLPECSHLAKIVDNQGIELVNASCPTSGIEKIFDMETKEEVVVLDDAGSILSSNYFDDEQGIRSHAVSALGSSESESSGIDNQRGPQASRSVNDTGTEAKDRAKDRESEDITPLSGFKDTAKATGSTAGGSFSSLVGRKSQHKHRDSSLFGEADSGISYQESVILSGNVNDTGKGAKDRESEFQNDTGKEAKDRESDDITPLTGFKDTAKATGSAVGGSFTSLVGRKSQHKHRDSSVLGQVGSRVSFQSIPSFSTSENESEEARDKKDITSKTDLKNDSEEGRDKKDITSKTSLKDVAKSTSKKGSVSSLGGKRSHHRQRDGSLTKLRSKTGLAKASKKGGSFTSLDGRKSQIKQRPSSLFGEVDRSLSYQSIQSVPSTVNDFDNEARDIIDIPSKTNVKTHRQSQVRRNSFLPRGSVSLITTGMVAIAKNLITKGDKVFDQLGREVVVLKSVAKPKFYTEEGEEIEAEVVTEKVLKGEKVFDEQGRVGAYIPMQLKNTQNLYDKTGSEVQTIIKTGLEMTGAKRVKGNIKESETSLSNEKSQENMGTSSKKGESSSQTRTSGGSQSRTSRASSKASTEGLAHVQKPSLISNSLAAKGRQRMETLKIASSLKMALIRPSDDSQTEILPLIISSSIYQTKSGVKPSASSSMKQTMSGVKPSANKKGTVGVSLPPLVKPKPSLPTALNAAAYMEKYRINDIFQLMLENLVTERPTNPLDYLISLVREVSISNKKEAALPNI